MLNFEEEGHFNRTLVDSFIIKVINPIDKGVSAIIGGSDKILPCITCDPEECSYDSS